MGSSGRFRAAGLPGGGVISAVGGSVDEFLLARGERLRFVDSVEYVCFVADCSGFLDCWEIVRSDKYTLSGGTASF